MTERVVRIKMSGAMRDLKYAKRLYCFLKRGAAGIKKQMRRKTRQSIKAAVEVEAVADPATDDRRQTLEALGFRLNASFRHLWRCGRCHRQGSDVDPSVYVPEGAEHYRDLRNLLRVVANPNGQSVAWCLGCAGQLLRLGGVDEIIAERRAKADAERVTRLASHGEVAAEHPSQTPCKECDGQAGYIGGWSSTIGAAFQLVMCPRCGWWGWERVKGDPGIQFSFSSHEPS